MHAIPILMYTSFTIDNKSTDSNSTSINKFEMDIRTLIDNGYAPIRLCDYHYHLSQNDEANEKLFSVIFVGGYENNYTLAFPLLKKYNIQASVFVAIDLVGVYEYPEVPGFTPHFGWEQAQEMIDSRLVDIYPWWHPFDEGKSIHEEIQRKEDILMKNLRDRSSKKAILYKDLDSNIVSIMNQLGLDIIITDCFHITANNIKAGVAASIQVGFNENVLDIIEHYSYLCNDTIEKDMSVTNIAAAPLSEVSSRVNNESIILEIDEKPRIKNYLRSAFPLAILQAANKEKTERFIINNFIDLIYKPHYNWLDYHNYYYEHWDILDCRKVTKDIIQSNNIEIIDYIINGLKIGYYSDIWLDTYYIPGKPGYRSDHMTHGLLIYGYKASDKAFLASSYTNSGHFQKMIVPISCVKAACSNAYFEYLNLVKYNPNSIVELDIQEIIKKLKMYISSECYDDNMRYSKKTGNQYYNYAACIKFSEKTRENKTGQIHQTSMFSYLEHKRCMAWRLCYLASFENMPTDTYEKYESFIKDTSEKTMNLALKYNLTRQQAILPRIVSLIDSINQKEKEIVMDFIHFFDPSFKVDDPIY